MNYEDNGREWHIMNMPNETTQQLIERCHYIFVTKKHLEHKERVRLSKIWHYVTYHDCKYNESVMSMI